MSRLAGLSEHTERLTAGEGAREISGCRTPEEANALCIALGLERDKFPDFALGIGRVYFVHCLRTKAVKVGFSYHPDRRLKSLQTGSPTKLICLGTIRGTPADEREIHKKLSKHRLQGEWFKANRWVLGYVGKRLNAGL